MESGNDMAAEACSIASCTSWREGSESARSASLISPSSNVEAPTAAGAVSGTTVNVSFTRRSVSSQAMLLIGASPPCVARNCQLGFTWKGRTAR